MIYLRSLHLLTGPQPQQEYSWLLNRLRNAAGLQDRRRITSYICITAEDQPYRVLDTLVARFDLRPASRQVFEEGDGWEMVPSSVSRESHIPVTGLCFFISLSPPADTADAVSRGSTAIASLRHILLQFPFLPIDVRT